MGRHKYSNKIEAEDLMKITIFQFRENVRNKGLQFGKNEWIDNYNRKHSLYATISINSKDANIRFYYEQDGIIVFNCTIQLTTSLCHYGKHRYWFVCPICQRNAGVMYLRGDLLACWKCQDLTYKSKNFGRKSRNYGFLNLMDVMPNLFSLTDNLRSRYYAGKPTRKFRKFIKYHAKNKRYVDMWINEIRNNPKMFE